MLELAFLGGLVLRVFHLFEVLLLVKECGVIFECCQGKVLNKILDVDVERREGRLEVLGGDGKGRFGSRLFRIATQGTAWMGEGGLGRRRQRRH